MPISKVVPVSQVTGRGARWHVFEERHGGDEPEPTRLGFFGYSGD
ncbi:hypothetical protein AB0K02_20100 [Streptomyces sp. NPDC049597]